MRETPTLNGLRVVPAEGLWGKWLWWPALLLAIVGWWVMGESWEPRPLVDVSVMAGLVIAPVGWSYDQVLLLLPVSSVLSWAADGSLARREALALGAALRRMRSPSTSAFKRPARCGFSGCRWSWRRCMLTPGSAGWRRCVGRAQGYQPFISCQGKRRGSNQSDCPAGIGDLCNLFALGEMREALRSYPA